MSAKRQLEQPWSLITARRARPRFEPSALLLACLSRAASHAVRRSIMLCSDSQARTCHGTPSSCSARAPRAGESLKPPCVLARLQLHRLVLLMCGPAFLVRPICPQPYAHIPHRLLSLDRARAPAAAFSHAARPDCLASSRLPARAQGRLSMEPRKCGRVREGRLLVLLQVLHYVAVSVFSRECLA